MKNRISIIVPAYQESERIGDSLKQILQYVLSQHLNAEIIVVDDGSKDTTSDVARVACANFPEVQTQVIRYEENRGKGFAVKTGLLAASGEIAVFSDADLSTPIEELPKLISPIESGEFDVTIGSRALNRELIGNRQPWRREQGGKVFNLIVRLATKLPFWDTQCGFKAFRMSKFRPLLSAMKIDRFGFDVEFLFVANLAKLKIKEVPVVWNHCDGTTISVFRDSTRMFREVNQIRQNEKKGFYKNVSKT
jgi:dolichyl-phosphate beta-glucosyltransferase